MKFLIVATFKSNKTNSEVQEWIESVSTATSRSTSQVVVAPSYPYLATSQWQLGSLKSKISLAAQDVSPFPPGSYTGAVNTEQLRDLGVSYCIVGHSERRRYFHETHAEIANKVNELVGAGITPILCVSEDDIFPQLAALNSENKDKVVYCFEPPAEIGGTETASTQEIERVIGLIKKAVDGARVMYGGSVNAGNVASLLPLGIDGVLVSSASLDPESFKKILVVYKKKAE